MSHQRHYRIKTPTIAILCLDGLRKTVTVPIDEVITISESAWPDDRLIDVVWKNQSYLMFTQDLRERGELSD